MWVYRKKHKQELLYLCSSPKYYQDDRLEDDEMGGECNTYGGNGKCMVFVKKPEEKRHLGRLSEDVSTTLKCILKE